MHRACIYIYAYVLDMRPHRTINNYCFAQSTGANIMRKHHKPCRLHTTLAPRYAVSMRRVVQWSPSYIHMYFIIINMHVELHQRRSGKGKTNKTKPATFRLELVILVRQA